MKYKIIYHRGDSIDIKTKVSSGSAYLSDDALIIESAGKFFIPFNFIKSMDKFRLHGLGRMIKIVHSSGTFYFSVVRFNILGYFAIVNFFKTGQMYELLKGKINNSSVQPLIQDGS